MSDFLNRWRVRRSQQAFEAQIAPYIDHMYCLAYRFTNSTPAAEDLVQDVLIKVYRMRKQFTDLDQPKPWLARVLYREFVDRWRREKRGAVNFSTLDAEDEGRTWEIEDETVNPEREVAGSQLQQQLVEALDELNPDQRTLVMLHDVEGYTLDELSVVLSLPIGTVKSRVHRARAKLREILGRSEGTIASVDSFSVSG